MPYLLAAAAATIVEDERAIIERYRKATSVLVHCRHQENDHDITVCARRKTDSYRLPFIVPTAGDPLHEGVVAERERLQHKTTLCDARGPFLIGCGSVGVSVGYQFGASGPKLRPLAE